MNPPPIDSTTPKARVFLVEDHPLVREGLTLLIDHSPDLTVCGGTDSVHGALELINDAKPDVVVVDIVLGSDNGLELVRAIRQHHRKLPILVLSMHDEGSYAEKALRVGAKGYVMKNEALDMVRTAIRRVLAGDIFVTDKMVSHLLKKVVNVHHGGKTSPIDLLTEREFEVFRMIAHGAGPSEIAQTLNLSVRTIDSHRDHIKEKLSLKSGAELKGFATQWRTDKR